MRRPMICALLLAVVCLAQGGAVRDLRCENATNPRNVKTPHPQLSWTWGGAAAPRGYQILVATSEDKLRANEADLWDSGLVRTDQKTAKYQGKPLSSMQHCYWKIRVWSDYDTPTFYTEPAGWQMGMLPVAE